MGHPKNRMKPPAENIIKPQAGPQMDFLKSSANIVFYGGSAGGG